MEGVDHFGKRELREIVCNQRTELQRYKTRLKDLVSAHKVLLNEKDLLEQSLKSLSACNVSSCGSETSKESSDDRPQGEESTKVPSDSSDSESTEHLKSQLATLMNSLAQLSEVKSRMEASFQADKKQLRSEKTGLEARINELEGRLEHETKAHLSEMEAFKSKLLSERHQREKEHNDHGVMIRELQKLVAEERSKRDKAEGVIGTLKSELNSTREALDLSRTELFESNSQMEALKEKLKDYKENSGAVAVKLQEELSQLKMQHMKVTLEEQEKIKEAEEKSKRLAAAHEERVAKLEERLAELSLTVGLYDRLRQGDQLAIEKLKDRLAQLERELGEEKGDLAVDDIVSRLKQLKKLMDSAGRSSDKPGEVKQILSELFDNEHASSDDIHKQCQEEYDQLKNEFDRYKHQFYISQQNVTPSYRVFETKENELNVQIKKLREIISNLHSQMHDNNVSHKQELERQKQLLGAEKIKFKEKLITIESSCKTEILQLESQLAKQRERAMKLVEEKDEEIAELKKSLNLLPRISTDKSGENEGVVLHYSEEMARRDVELTRLRKDKLSLEAALRDSRRDMSQLVSHEKHLSSLLQHQIERFEHCQSREGANLEYLKNVVFSFLLSTDSNSKSHMLNAITAVLKFTDAERAKIAQSSWWFNHP